MLFEGYCGSFLRSLFKLTVVFFDRQINSCWQLSYPILLHKTVSDRYEKWSEVPNSLRKVLGAVCPGKQDHNFSFVRRCLSPEATLEATPDPTRSEGSSEVPLSTLPGHLHPHGTIRCGESPRPPRRRLQQGMST